MKQMLAHSKTYKVHKKIGEGGFGVVFLVQDITTDPNFRKPLALKVIKEAKLDLCLRDYYLKISNLGLSNVVSFYGVEYLDQKFGLLYEYIQGPNLRDYIKEEKCSKKIKNLIIQICVTLSKLHQNEMFHGDLDFENLLVHAKRGIIFIDFDPRFNVARRNLHKKAIEADLENLREMLCEIIESFPEISIETQSFLFSLATEIEEMDSNELLYKFSNLNEEQGVSYEYNTPNKPIDSNEKFYTRVIENRGLRPLELAVFVLASLIIFFPG